MEPDPGNAGVGKRLKKPIPGFRDRFFDLERLTELVAAGFMPAFCAPVSRVRETLRSERSNGAATVQIEFC